MNFWSSFPFVRITTLFAIGILLSKFGIKILPSELTHQLLLFLFLFLSWLFSQRIKRIPEIVAIFSTCLLIVLGAFRYHSGDDYKDRLHLLNQDLNFKAYSAKIVSPVKQKDNYETYQISVNKLFYKNDARSAVGLVQLYIKQDRNRVINLKYGDALLIKENPFRIPAPQNPEEFDFSQYMANNHIYHQQFVTISGFEEISNHPDNRILSWAYNTRAYLNDVFNEHLKDPAALGIAKALILGIKDDLDNDVKRAYAAAGAMHVLAVSGLHVGIIIVIISLLLKPFSKSQNGKIITTIISILILWTYALLTGLSPSIFRAATMFSVILIGRLIKGRSNVYNSLAIAALVLLLYEPNSLFNVGFQLSFVAVLGIVYLFPIIHRQFIFDSWLMEKIWAVTCISLAAQIATFPLTIYYFNQFPTYFFVSNLVVIPAAFIIMYLGIFLCVFGQSVIGTFIGNLLEFVISILNIIVNSIEKWSLSIIDWIFLYEHETISIYIILVLLALMFKFRRFSYLYSILFIISVLVGIRIVNIINQFHSRQIIFYEISNESVFDNIDGLEARLTTPDSIRNLELVQFQVEPYRLRNHLDQISENVNSIDYDEKSGLGFYSWMDKKFIFVNRAVEIEYSEKIKCDYLVLRNNAAKDLKQLTHLFEFTEIIVDSSNDFYTCKKLAEAAKQLDIPIKILRFDGAYIIDA